MFENAGSAHLAKPAPSLDDTLGRQDIDLDAGWSFGRVPNPPSVWDQADSVPRSAWRVVSVSSEETAAELAGAANAIDGNPNTIWHTRWSKDPAPYPHEIVIDLGGRVTADGLRLLPRQTSPQNGRPNHFRLFLANSTDLWGPPVLEGAVPDSPALFQSTFKPIDCRFLRLVVLDGHRPNEPFLALSEIGLMRPVGLEKNKDWASQYNIASVQVGGDQYDPSPGQIDRLRVGELAAIKPSNWRPVVLPHAAWLRDPNRPEIWQGVSYYRRSLDFTPSQIRRHIELRLDGAMQVSSVWLNGNLVGGRRGGYLPVIVDLTDKVLRTNDLLVRVDNRDNPLVPPGKPQQQLDFMYGNGLYRNASLTLTPRSYITTPDASSLKFGGGVYVVTTLATPELAALTLTTGIWESRPGIACVRHRLYAPEGNPISTGYTEAKDILGPTRSTHVVVPNPRLWSPAHPNLYRLKTELWVGGRLVDSVMNLVGIRTISVSREKGFVLNGEPIYLSGTNRHQDYPWIGPALSDAANARDALLIKRAGHNIVRLSHYPQSPAFLDACDRYGLMVIPCIPGWQFINQDPRFEASVESDIRGLIRRDRNHPCVAFWETSLNETYPPAALAKKWYDCAKAEAIGDNILLAGDSTRGAPWDIGYNGWQEDLSRPQDNLPDKPGYIREYGDYEFGGQDSTSRVKLSGSFDQLMGETWNHIWSLNKFYTQYPWTMGAGTWEMFDHNVPWDFSVSASGLADIWRREKPSYWFFASQFDTAPYLKIAADWQARRSSSMVVVFTNADSVTLSVGGKPIATKTSARSPAAPYDFAHRWGDTDTGNLPHPPIIFRNVPFSPGVLQASGSYKGALVSDHISSSGPATGVVVRIDDLGIPVTANDTVFVRATAVDSAGTPCRNASGIVHFRVEGAEIIGSATARLEQGVASVLVRTPIHLVRIAPAARLELSR